MSRVRKVFFDWAPCVLLALTAVILSFKGQTASATLVGFLSGMLTGFVIARYLDLIPHR